MAVGTASCIWLLPIVGLFIFRLNKGFLPSAAMVGIFSCLVGALTLSPWKLSVFEVGTTPKSYVESPSANSSSHGYSDSLPDKELPAPPEAKSDFKTGYE